MPYIFVFACLFFTCSHPTQSIKQIGKNSFFLLKDLEINNTQTLMGMKLSREIDCAIPPFECDNSKVVIYDTNFVFPDSLKLLWSAKTRFLGNIGGVCDGYILPSRIPFAIYLFPERFLSFNKDSVFITSVNDNGLLIKYRTIEKILTPSSNDSFVVADSILDTIHSPANDQVTTIEKNTLTHIIKISELDMSHIYYPKK